MKQSFLMSWDHVFPARDSLANCSQAITDLKYITDTVYIRTIIEMENVVLIKAGFNLKYQMALL
jgi:hypothetical protein